MYKACDSITCLKARLALSPTLLVAAFGDFWSYNDALSTYSSSTWLEALLFTVVFFLFCH